MSTVLTLGLAPGVETGPGFISGPFSRTTVPDLGLLAALDRGLDSEAMGEANPLGASLRSTVDALHRRQHLAWRLRDESGALLAQMQPLTRDVPLPWPASPQGELALSRFALVRRDGEAWLLESGLSPLTITLSDDAVAQLFSALRDGQREDPLIALLAAAGMLASDDVEAQLWEFHDRYFANRATTDVWPSGGTFRFADTIAPEPFDAVSVDAVPVDAEPADTMSDFVALPVPDVPSHGPGLWDAMEARRTVREFSDRPVTVDELGALLWRTVRRQDALLREPDDPRSYDRILRPVPSAGATHAIDLWLDCRLVEGMDRGMWKYDPTRHGLIREPADVADADSRAASLWSHDADQAPVRGICVVRHARLAWKYERIALLLALKDAGVMLYALQLAASGLGLGMWPFGSGPQASTLQRLRLSAHTHVPVGEFALGHPR